MSLKQKIIQICKDFSNEIGTDKEDAIYDFGKVVIIRNKGRDYVCLKSDFIINLLREATKQVLLFQKEAFKEFTKNPNAHDRYYAGKMDAYTEVLAVLEGAEQK